MTRATIRKRTGRRARRRPGFLAFMAYKVRIATLRVKA
jgi:hypothetical protein